MNNDSENSLHNNTAKPVLRKQTNWENLYFYQKANVLYQLTFVFTKRFLKRGDRTIDQSNINGDGTETAQCSTR